MNIIDIVSKLFPITLLIIQLIILVAIKMNDMKHIADEIRDIKKVVEDINKKILEHECRIAKLEGRLNGKSN
jgi:uncharacterized protein (DUF1330 family)